MKTWIWILHISALFLLVSCQQSQDKVVEKHYVQAPIPAPNDNSDGAVDPVGGGNGINGQSLENFRVNLEEMRAYQEVRRKVIDKLLPRMPKLASELLHIAEARNWFMLPVDLKKLPPEKVGVLFDSEQFALHGTQEIWFDQKRFSAMEPLDQENLILHELIMGVRFLEFSDPLDRCYASIADRKLKESDRETYQSLRDLCTDRYKKAADVDSSLGLQRKIPKDFDVPAIRHLTITLMKEADSVDPKTIEAYLSVHGFRNY